MVDFVLIIVFIFISLFITPHILSEKLKNASNTNVDEVLINKVRFVVIFSGILSFFLFLFEQYIIYPSTVDLIPLQFLTITLSITFSIAVGIYIYKGIKNNSFKYDLVKKYSFFIFVSTFIPFMMTIKYLNVWNDKSQLQVVQDTIQGKRDSNRSPFRKYFDLVNNSNDIDTYEIRVYSDVYNKKQIGDKAIIYVKQGNFNIRWIEKVE